MVTFRTQRPPPFPIEGVRPLVHVRLANVPDADPVGAARLTKETYEELELDQEDYCVWLNRYGGAWHHRFRLAYPEVLADMTRWDDPCLGREDAAIAWWREWTLRYVAELDRLDQTPHSFLMDTERPDADLPGVNRIVPAMNGSFYEPVRAKFQNIRLGNWRETLPHLSADVQCPRLYHGPADNRRTISTLAAIGEAGERSAPIVPWILHPCAAAGLGGTGVHGEWQTIQTVATCMEYGVREFICWGSTDVASWDALERVVDVVKGIGG